MSNTTRGGLLILSLTLLCAGAATGTPGYYYTYFDEARFLALDETRVAVFDADPARGQTSAACLAAHGLAPDTAHPVAVAGWTTTRLPAAERSDAGVQARVAALAQDAAIDFASPVFIDSRGLPLLITRDLLVGFVDGVAAARAEQVLADTVGGTLLDRDFAGLPGVYRVRSGLENGFDVLTVANNLALDPAVRFAEPDMIIRAELALIPNDPEFPTQWALQQASDEDMDAPEAWDLTTGDGDVVVVVMDCGIEQGHPDLNQIPGQDFTQHGTIGGGPHNNCDDHGTSVAGCVSAVINNGQGVVGVAPTCTVTSAKMGTVVSIFGFCTPFMDSQASYLVNSLGWAVSSGYHVTNSSFSYENTSAVTTAYNTAHANGVVNFAATGNSGEGSISYPSSLGSVVAVGAMSSNGLLASFSQYGSGIAFCAPGEGIRTTDRVGSAGYANGNTATVDGTSFASPYAAGVAALVLSRNADLSPDEVEQAMSEGCVDKGAFGYDTTYGWGFVNALGAVQAAAPPQCPGDSNCDGVINWRDVDFFVAAQNNNEAAWVALFAPATPTCLFANNDVNRDSNVNWRDVDPFVSIQNTTCR